MMLDWFMINYELCIMNYELCIMNYELCIMNYELWIVHYELWIMNCALWILNSPSVTVSAVSPADKELKFKNNKKQQENIARINNIS